MLQLMPNEIVNSEGGRETIGGVGSSAVPKSKDVAVEMKGPSGTTSDRREPRSRRAGGDHDKDRNDYYIEFACPWHGVRS